MFEIIELYADNTLYEEYKNNSENFMTYVCWGNSLKDLYNKETTEMLYWSYNWICIALEKHSIYPIYRHIYIKRRSD